MKRIVYLVLGLVLILGLLVVSCSQPAPTPKPTASPSPSPTASPKPSPTATATPTPSPSPKPVPIKEWVSQAAAETTYGYTVGAALSRIANQALEKAGVPVRMKNVIGPGSTVNFRSYDKGETDMHYMSTFANLQAWTNTGAFEKEPLKHKSYHGIYMFSADNLPIIRPADTAKIKTYADFAGKNVWPYQLGSAAYESSKVALEALGLWDKINVKQVGYDQVGSSLQSGVFDVAIITVIGGGRSTPPWTRDLVLTKDINVVIPSASEKATLGKVKGLTPTIFPAERFFAKKDVGASEIWTFSMYQGWNFPSYGTEQEVYTMVKAWYENTKDLIAIDPGFAQFAEEGLKFNAAILDGTPEVPVHPGVAKYYKEKGIWKDTWKIGVVAPKDW
ncbi:MAG: TAXI family TRAP transporter solute-binding subunit [Dehalococcoidales bacterium]|nr:TAXI family TRAP transporter solute-binding subunit [Dehalococcoidales bacterium]